MWVRITSYIFIAVGFALLFLSLLIGHAKFGIFIVFPFVYGYGILPAISFLLIIVGIFLFFLSPMQFKYENVEPITEEKKVEKHFGGVVLIGPIPIIFGSDRNTVLISVLATILILIVLFIFLFFVFQS